MVLKLQRFDKSFPPRFSTIASLNGSKTSLADTIRAWSSTLAVFPQILAEPLDVLAKRWSLN